MTRATPRTDWPPIPPPPGVDPAPVQFAVATDTPLNSIQKTLITASLRQHRGSAPGDPSIRRGVYEQVKTHGAGGPSGLACTTAQQRATPAASDTLVKVVILSRHGVRSPIPSLDELKK